ncbi:hypothetical protein QO002_005009 [Pararhizobium capsulatum DSM 1112]|uniref:Uncharacterized protein n=1 Tax=Pararhizobium capsulatum DSM 1112 TaxID=1121113 RepID=A0ABU0BX07_9HYPH|nr:hypothetical protein [Pararhizobium capsulatum]MDQ0322803.1 hypothetical protein [Pararhizobium capsulatum DSM 1112]
MAVFFRTFIDENTAFARLERALSHGPAFDGYLDIHGELTLSRPRDMSADTFRQHIADELRSVWEKAPVWAIYERNEKHDLSASEITAAAVQLSANYEGAFVITLSILGRDHSPHDLELTFICFRQEAERRNFRARYEGKFISR